MSADADDAAPERLAGPYHPGITLSLLSSIDAKKQISQRAVAQELGVALGLVNAYIRRCVKKGLVKVSQIPPNRYSYYLTPKGFAEKSRLTSEFLFQSLNLFRQARSEYDALIRQCAARDWRRVVLFGGGELAEIATLCAADSEVKLVANLNPNATDAKLAGMPVFTRVEDLPPADAALVTELKSAREAYEMAVRHFTEDRVLVPPLLEIARNKIPTPPDDDSQ